MSKLEQRDYYRQKLAYENNMKRQNSANTRQNIAAGNGKTTGPEKMFSFREQLRSRNITAQDIDATSMNESNNLFEDKQAPQIY